MMQTLVAVAALGCAILLAFSSKKSAHLTDRWEIRNEIEARAASVADELLDLAATLPFDGRADEAGEPLSLEAAVSLAAWDGHRQRVVVPAGETSLALDVVASVEPVQKAGDVFVPAGEDAPFRRVRLHILGPMDVTVEAERVLAPAAH